MDSRSFPEIEKRIAPMIVELLEEIIEENLVKEIEMTMRAEAAKADVPF